MNIINKKYPFHIIRFEDFGQVQHITTDGNMCCVTTINTAHHETVGTCIGVSEEDYQKICMFPSGPLYQDSIMGMNFDTVNPDLVPDLNLLFKLPVENPPTDLYIDPKLMTRALKELGKIDEFKIRFSGTDLPIVLQDGNRKIYIMGRG